MGFYGLCPCEYVSSFYKGQRRKIQTPRWGLLFMSTQPTAARGRTRFRPGQRSALGENLLSQLPLQLGMMAGDLVPSKQNGAGYRVSVRTKGIPEGRDSRVWWHPGPWA